MGRSRIRGPVRGADCGDPDVAGIAADDTPGPTGIGYDRATDISMTAGVPNGVHDTRTAIAYAQTNRRMRLYRLWSNRSLIERARFLSHYLLGACVGFGAQAQSETACLLIDLEEEMARRLRAARTGADGLPVLDGIHWDPDDPLAGVTSGIPPFGMLDVWTTYLREPPVQEIVRQRRRRRRRDTVEFDDDLVIGQGPSVSLSQVIASIPLQLAQGSFAHWFVQRYGNNIVSGNFGAQNPSYITGTGGIRRVAFAPPLPQEHAQLRRIYMDIDSGPYQTDDILYFARMRRELQRVVDAWEFEVNDQASNRQQGERADDVFNTSSFTAFSSVMRGNPPEIRISQELRRVIVRGRR